MKINNHENESKKSLIYDELNKFSKIITNYFAQEIQDYLNLINFFEQVSSELKEIHRKIKIPKYLNKNNSDNLNLNSFYSFHSSFLNKLMDIPEKINVEIISTLKKCKEEFESDNRNVFISLSSIIEEISENKKNLDKGKNDKIGLKNEFDNEEIKNSSLFYSDIEKKFLKIKKLFEENELKKNKIISNCLYIYFNMIQSSFDSLDDHNNEINKLIKKYKKNQEKKSINEYFPNSKILNIKNWGKDLSGWEDLEKKEATNNNLNEYYVPQITLYNNFIGIDDEYMILKHQDNQNNSFNIIEDEERIKDNISITNFIYRLENLNQDENLLLNVEDIFGRKIGNKEFYIDFCDRILKARKEKKTFYEFKYFLDLVYLSNLLTMILENIKEDLLSNNISKDYFDSYKILDKIICIGEKSFNEETYMCTLLSRNKIFKNQKIWINSIKNKIIILLNDLCKKEYLSKEEEFNPVNFIQKNVKKIPLGKIMGKIGGLLGKGKDIKLIELCGFNKLIEYYPKLSKEQRKKVDNNALSIYHGVIKCYIRHITNYNIHLENTTDIISLICNDLNINNEEYIIFYCYYYQDCAFTTKKMNSKFKSFISQENMEKINYIKSENKNKKIAQKYIFNIKSDSSKYFIIKKASKFLDDEDKLKLICLGKYYEKIRKNIYKSFLKKDISLKRRLHIWKSYLKFDKTTSLYNYKEILKETQEEFFKKVNEQSIIQIEKDKKRTYLRKENEKSPQQIFNILISFVYSENKVNYVQGINSITGFLYDLTENEEDTFHFLISIFIMTQIRDIYEDEEFKKLKTYFYVFERLVYLYLPKIYNKLKDNNIELSFFMSAYFITLNTILYPSLPEDDISFLIHLWDEFLLDGWRSFNSSWLAILKYHEKDIMTCENAELFNFVTNKIKESKLFKKENYPKFYELKKKFKVSEELIRNLQDEIAVEVGIKKVGTSTIIEGFNADDKEEEIK